MAVKAVTKRKRSPVRTGIPRVRFGEPFMMEGCKVPMIINQFSTTEDPDTMEVKGIIYNRVSKHV